MNLFELNPAAHAKETHWLWHSEYAQELGVDRWAPHAEQLRRAKGFKRCLSLLQAAVADEPFWATRQAARHGFEHAWFIHALERLRAHPLQPLWTPLTLLLVVEQVHKPSGLCSQFRDYVHDALAEQRPQSLGHALESVPDQDLRVFVDHSRQRLPELLAQVAVAQKQLGSKGEEAPPTPLMLMRVRPWSPRGPFTMHWPWESGWWALGRADIDVGADLADLPPRVLFRRARGKRDPQLLRLAREAEAADAEDFKSLLQFFFVSASNTQVTEIVLVAVDEGVLTAESEVSPAIGLEEDIPETLEGQSFRVVGCFLHNAVAQARGVAVHQIDVPFVYVAPALRHRHLDQAISQAVAHGMATLLEEEYVKVVPPGQPLRLHLTPPIGRTGRESFHQDLKEHIEALCCNNDNDAFELCSPVSILRTEVGVEEEAWPALRPLVLEGLTASLWADLVEVVSRLPRPSEGPVVVRWDEGDVRLSSGYAEAEAPIASAQCASDYEKEAFERFTAAESAKLFRKVLAVVRNIGEKPAEALCVFSWSYQVVMPEFAWQDIDGWGALTQRLGGRPPLWLVYAQTPTPEERRQRHEAFWRCFPEVLEQLAKAADQDVQPLF